MERPEAVIFDIGNVLIRWQPEQFYDARIGRAAREALFAAVDLHAMNDRIDRGAPFRETVYAVAERHPDHAAAIRLWHDAWIEIASPDMPMTARLNAALRANGVATHILSNIGAEPYAHGCARYPALAEVDHAFLSGPMACAKPDDEIYASVEAALGVAPGRLLFTDDRAENIAAAARRGWQTHLFDGPEGLAVRLVELGLLSPEQAELERA
jgi:2-haloacid dehalogenase